MTVPPPTRQIRAVLWWPAVLSAGLIPVYLLVTLVRGTRMPFGDYFYMLSSIFAPDGAFTPGGLLVHANEHLIAIPKLVFAVNVRLFDGSNITLSVFVWLVSLATLLLVAWCLRSFLRGRTTRQVVVIWLLVATCFPLSAMHNYVYGMSGSAWILANMFAVGAIALGVRGLTLTSGAAGVLATFTYGTGLAVWPALVLLLILRRSRPNWRDGAMLTMGLLAVWVERATRDIVYGHPLPIWNPMVVVRSLSISVGSFFTGSLDVALMAGLGMLIWFIFALRVLLPRTLTRPEMFIVGMGAYALTALLMMAVSRSAFGDDTFTVSRYMAVVGVFVLSLGVLGLFVWGDARSWPWITAFGVSLTLVAAVPTIDHFQEVVREQDVAAVAVRLGVAEGYLRGFEAGSGALLQTLGNYPFDGGSGPDCGLLGAQVPTRLVRSDQVNGTVDNVSAAANGRAVNVSGWAYSARPIQCVLILDAQGTVIGAGVRGIPRQDVRAAYRFPVSDVGWEGVAARREGTQIRAGVVLKDSQEIYLLGDGLPVQVP